jgi:di/tripeptidase
MMNFKLLKSLYQINSKSGQEKQIITFLVEYVQNNFTNVQIEVDTTGNIYITKGKAETYPVIVAHTDQVGLFGQSHADKKIMESSHDSHTFGAGTEGESIDMDVIKAVFQQIHDSHPLHKGFGPDGTPAPAAVTGRIFGFDDPCFAVFKFKVMTGEAVPLVTAPFFRKNDAFHQELPYF